jgi:hypothetical protein
MNSTSQRLSKGQRFSLIGLALVIVAVLGLLVAVAIITEHIDTF